MTTDERESFLAGLHVGVLSVESADGPPLTVPIWYAYTPGGDVEIITGGASLKGRFIDRAGRFSLCAQTEEPPYRYVSVSGPVVSTEATRREEHLRPMARRYLGEAMGDAYVGEAPEVDEESLVIRMRPERWWSVDYGKA